MTKTKKLTVAKAMAAMEADKNNEIHVRTSGGYEYWSEYDENNHLIHIRDSDGYAQWNEYDEKGNLIHVRTSGGYEWWA
jgi:hypothetical protein